MTGTLAAAGLGVVVTASLLMFPELFSGYRSRSAHLVIETADASVALLAAYLAYGRLLRHRRRQDLLLMQGLVLLAVAGLALTVLVGLFGHADSGRLEVWLPFATRVIGVLMIAGAALQSGRKVRIARRLAIAVPLGIAGVVAAVLWWQQERLPLALDPGSTPQDATSFTAAHPVLVAGQLLALACFLLASVAFTAQATKRSDEVVRWLGPACMLAAFARVSYLVYPSVYSNWVYAGDAFRSGFYLLLLVGASREIRQYWTAQAESAVVEDRRRLARELHDGVIQEVGYIRAESAGLRGAAPERAERIIAACDRALDEARQAVEVLGAPGNEPLGFALHRAARQVAERYDVMLELDVDDALTAEPDERHALVRIAREAVSNAARHGKASRVRIVLGRDEAGRRLVVEDDGAGFDLDTVTTSPTGFGLISMRERARGLPGELHISSAPGSGTAVTVRW
ncbi:sensor histidine kinase [Kribbella sp. HUAS MG21]|uniref:Sensor histidine kinase n=1 Tax=Kribbella sp. HUAS MG21 TaxID=3160966 RepID=A0AAU7T7W9_9ACTN